MRTIRFKKFTKPQFLRQVGRKLVARLFGQFSGELAAGGLTLPPAGLDEDAYFQALAGLVLSPEGLPDRLIETLFAIEEMANAEGQARLEAAVAAAGLDLTFSEESSYGDLAVQVFLACPELLAAQHNELGMSRLAAFEYYGSQAPVDRSDAMTTPGPAVLEPLVADLDTWFQAHHRGEETTQLEVHAMDGEFWFLVRHGDTFARTARVKRRRTEMLHFRPAKDDVVVYSPERDEIRIHAGTKGERQVYRRAFGRRLCQGHDYFSVRKAYTLEPLRADGVTALSTEGIEGIRGIALCELEVAWDGEYAERSIRKANDLFAAAQARNRAAIPAGGRLVRAVFEISFAGAKRPRRVQVRPPNALQFGRHADALLVHRWLSARGFRVSANLNPAGGVGSLAGRRERGQAVAERTPT